MFFIIKKNRNHHKIIIHRQNDDISWKIWLLIYGFSYIFMTIHHSHSDQRAKNKYFGTCVNENWWLYAKNDKFRAFSIKNVAF